MGYGIELKIYLAKNSIVNLFMVYGDKYIKTKTNLQITNIQGNKILINGKNSTLIVRFYY